MAADLRHHASAGSGNERSSTLRPAASMASIGENVQIHDFASVDNETPRSRKLSQAISMDDNAQRSRFGAASELTLHDPALNHQSSMASMDSPLRTEGLASARDAALLHAQQGRLGAASDVTLHDPALNHQISMASMDSHLKAKGPAGAKDAAFLDPAFKDQETSLASKETETKPPEIEYPEGGLRAWLVVFGAVCCNVVSFGYVSSFGVFQSYYEQTLLSDQSPSTIAWIGSIQSMLLFFSGLIGGILFDMGHFRVPLLSSCALLVACTFLVGECTEFWQFLLCQGIASGLAAGMLFSPVMTVISHWFNKRRGLAVGIVTAGSSIGGVIVPIATRKLIPEVGFPWTCRILGFLFLALLIEPNLALKRRIPPKPPQGLSSVWDSKIFIMHPEYSVYVLGGFFAFLGFYSVLTYIDISAVSVGVPEDFSFYLVAILNGVSFFGRILSGRLSDSIGSGNVVIPSLAVAGAVAFGWPFAKSQGALIAIAVTYGLASGTYIATFALPMFKMGDMKDAGRRLGMSMLLLSFAALAGSPISGAIYKNSGSFVGAGSFAGACMLLSALLTVWARYLSLKGWKGRF